MTNKRIFDIDRHNLQKAANLLQDGQLVSFPTETVYGLGADATNGQAVATIFAAKNRPSFNPLIIHLTSISDVEKYTELDETSRQLAEKFWPGPFTLILPVRKDAGLSELVTAGLDTVAVRIPNHPVAQELLKTCGRPLAAPSANKSGHISPTMASHVDQEFGQELSMILDGGPCSAGVESTIVQINGDKIHLLRPGSITPKELQEESGLDVLINSDADNIIAPGQMKSHYAPNAAMRLNVTDPFAEEAYLAFGNSSHGALNLSPSGDLKEAAANLFSMMRRLDEETTQTIAVAPIPMEGIGLAINDRLQRAAAPKEKKS